MCVCTQRKAEGAVIAEATQAQAQWYKFSKSQLASKCTLQKENRAEFEYFKLMA